MNVTIFENINKLQKGHFLVYQFDREIKITKYYDLCEKLSSQKNNPYELNDRLKKAVNYRKISDVPIGAFLSGGIDSSMICLLFPQNSEKPINTFTIGFEEKTHDESLYAEKVSLVLKSKHHLKNISNNFFFFSIFSSSINCITTFLKFFRSHVNVPYTIGIFCNFKSRP